MTIHPTPSLQFAPMRPVTPRSVAVIGAGAGGLVAARELRREGHKVVVFEREDKVGGTWVYNPNIDSDPIGIDPSRNVVHSSLYASLRTNLPREVMGCREYPFVATNKTQRDPRRFPGHREVLEYLNDYVSEFGLNELLRFGTEVSHVGLVEEGKWKVRSGIGEDRVDEIYDAVVVCNGHYTEPRIAEIPGIDVWPGKQIHSHNYRVPEPFRDQVVVLIGSSASAVDISRDIAAVAKEVHIASRSVKKDGTLGKLPGYENMWLHSMIENVHEDGTVVFKDGGAVCADVILHCTGFHSRHAGTSLVAFGTENSRSGEEDHRALETLLRLCAAIKNRNISEVSDIIGEECQCVCNFNSIKYKYYFPFLDTSGIVAVDDNCVGPLYKHIFPPFLAPRLSFVGLPFKVVPFPLFEFQSKWIAGVLSGRLVLPSPEEMLADVEAFYLTLEASGVPKRYTHNLADDQFKYEDWLAAECGCPPVEEWRKEMYLEASKNRLIRPETYRDEWDDHHLVSQAHEDFGKYLSNGDLGEIIPQYLQQHLKI